MCARVCASEGVCRYARACVCVCVSVCVCLCVRVSECACCVRVCDCEWVHVLACMLSIPHHAGARPCASLRAVRAASPLPAAPVFNPAGAIALGTSYTKDCPEKTSRMSTAAACAVAAALTSRPFSQFTSSAAVPGGCGWLTAGGSFYFNADLSGGGENFFAQPVCAGAPGRSIHGWIDTHHPYGICRGMSTATKSHTDRNTGTHRNTPKHTCEYIYIHLCVCVCVYIYMYNIYI